MFQGRWKVWVLLAAAVPAAAWGAPVEKTIVTVTPEAYRAHIDSLRGVVNACAANASACDSDKVGNDDRVEALHFDMRWQWLRGELDHAKTAKPDERQSAMRDALARLDETTADGAATAAPLTRARTEATKILDSAEFRNVREFNWWDRVKAKFFQWLTRAFSGVANWAGIGQTLMTVLEWLFFGAAAVGLVFMLRRSLSRQRLAIAEHTGMGISAWDRESNDWAAQADSSAGKGDFRDAVHCLYWASIVMLEGRRAWRHNPTRTPREYVRLLKPGSAQQGALRKLTQLFERLWYGLRDAQQTDYDQARALFETLRDKNAATTEAA